MLVPFVHVDRKFKKHFIKMLNDVGMEVLKSEKQ